jgi:hypothetical protein
MPSLTADKGRCRALTDMPTRSQECLISLATSHPRLRETNGVHQVIVQRWGTRLTGSPLSTVVPDTRSTDFAIDEHLRVRHVRIPRDGEQSFHGIVNMDSTAT